MSNFIGIDLGTTFSVVAQIDETGRPVIVANRAGNNITPSVVEFKEDNTVEVGAEARRRLFVDENAVGRFKRAMGTSRTYEVRGKTYTPTQLSAFVLKKLIQDTKEAIGPIADVIVSIPANFANEAREATLAAAKEAGFDIKYIVDEPTAAALYYAYKGGTELSGTYAVYDLGGGTFDISIIRVQGQDVEVLAANGITQCGGDDFDRALHQVIKNKYKQITGEELDDEDFSVNDAENEKISLSTRDKAVARVARQNIEITRNEFEESIASLISQARLLTEATVDEVDLSVNELSGVFLVGGSTRLPAVKESVRSIFGAEPISSANVDEVVALGAAIYAAYKGDRTKLNAVQKKTIEKIKVNESTAMCFGVIAVNTNRGDLYNSVIIRKNEKIPCSRTESYFTVTEGQEGVNIQVTESRSPEKDPTFVKIIQEGELKLPPGRPAEQEIKVTFSFDENQIMHCTFVDVASGREEIFALSPTQGSRGTEPRDGEMDKFTVE